MIRKQPWNMKNWMRVFMIMALLISVVGVKAQNGQPARQKIALFAPLYLDSVFSNNNYRYGSTFPRFVNPGLEFYQGAQMALDSLKKAGAPLDVFVYDSRGRHGITQRLASADMRNVDMIIAHATLPEVRTLADAAQQKKVPFISATLPNDAGIAGNPYLVILNSTLRTHCEGIYEYLQKYHSLDRVIVYQKPGAQEDQIKEYLEEVSRSANGTKVKIEFKNIGSSFDTYSVQQGLDSTRKTIAIAGSLDERFGVQLAQNLVALRNTYPITIIGMPTWDGLSEFNKSEYKEVEVVYTTPFYYSRTTSLGNKLAAEFEDETSGRPSDMFYRGYETTLRFALLLLETKKDVASNLTRKGNYIFTQFDIQPVFLNKQNMTLDYFENKKLYFVKLLNGNRTVL